MGFTLRSVSRLRGRSAFLPLWTHLLFRPRFIKAYDLYGDAARSFWVFALDASPNTVLSELVGVSVAPLGFPFLGLTGR
jgi:hypothetical protein